MWTIYDHPTDFPMEFVARKVTVTHMGPIPSDELITGGTLEEVRDQLPPGLWCQPCDPDDDPCIVETWF